MKIKKTRVKRRQMERQMRRMGVDFEQLDGVTEVVIRLPDKELVLSNPQVVKMKAQGENVYQVVGEPVERAVTVTSASTGETPTSSSEPFTDEDVQLVANQASVSEEEARQALREARGNLAKAIIALTGG